MKQLFGKRWGNMVLSIGLCTAFLFGSSLGAPANSAFAYSASQAQSIISTGENYLHTPYKFGAPIGTTKVFDCSSFTATIFGKYGVKLPRSSAAQSKAGTFVPRSQLQPGDLVFFYSPIHHVGVYIGNGKIMHTYGKPGVTISDLNSGWWSQHYTTARRVL
ncbi:NlpC/P60 family protein [Paenibacillus tianmuensis]|uniref:NlpC/P60 family protein n=1 Tax=Paenibacillus tianmuensis TaxID=624147 RepID=A0A1G4QBC5_9BACL|nr:C40 family peptidase [Paenibacillus tianmuensis]SCW41802.1 NlpC/P60 family protein [Paenibacillus tianmuensis]